MTEKVENLMDYAVRFSDAILRSGKPLLSRIYVHFANETIMAFEYKYPDPEETAETKKMLVVSMKQAIAEGKIGSFVSLGEAWMADVPKYHNMLEVMPPGKDPNRKEIVMIAAYGVDGRQMKRFDIETSNGIRKLGKEIEDLAGSDWECWLDGAVRS